MKRRLPVWLLVIGVVLLASHARAETETIDLKALAKKARPAVMLLVVSDANGKEIATGTGFLVSSDGKLITNHHVIEGAASAVAKAENGGLFPVEGVLADDPKNDLVLLKLKGKDLPFLPLGNSDKIEVGTRIAVIGSPLGLEGSLSEGIVSAVRDLMGDSKVLQVTAAISPGSSGSPVMNAKGDVVGIASALLRGGQALNFAVSVECGTRLMARVKPSSVPQPINQSANAGGEDAISADPDWRAGSAANAAGDYVEMLKRAKVLVARYPDNASVWSMLGVAFLKLNFTDDAIAAYRQAIKLKPDDPRAWNMLGHAYRVFGRSDDAIAAYRQAFKLKPDDPDAWENLGSEYMVNGRFDDALAVYLQVVKLRPDNPRAWNMLGGAYSLSGHSDDAIAAYRQAIKLEPDDGWHWDKLGEAYSKSGRTDDAIAAWEQVIKLAPYHTETIYTLSKVYTQRKDFGKARRILIVLESVDPIFVDHGLASEAWHNLGAACSEAGRIDEANDAFERAKRLKP